MSKKNPTPEEIAALFGFDVNEVAAKMPSHGKKAKKKISKEADAVRARVYNPGEFIDRKCKNCGRLFSVNYKYHVMCSDECRIADFEKIGLKWDSTKTGEARYQAMRIDPPAVVPPDALQALIELGRQYLSDVPEIQGVRIHL